MIDGWPYCRSCSGHNSRPSARRLDRFEIMPGFFDPPHMGMLPGRVPPQQESATDRLGR
jgi:hypothetical protein